MRLLRPRLSAGLAMTIAGVLFLFYPSSAFAIDLKIVAVSYDQHANPDQSFNVTVLVKNNESSTQFAEVDVTVTNTATEAETTLTPVLSVNIPGGETGILSNSYTLAAGTYSVSFPLFDGNGVRVDRIQGKFPIHIGTETESLHVFPEVIPLGLVPPGRYMHPTPIEVRWSYYRFNRLRLDQPFVVRLYTDNTARYQGIRGAVRRGSPGGLVSLDGKYTIPFKVWCLNYGPDIQETGWDSALAGPPPVDEDNAWLGPPLLEGGRHLGGANWVRVKDRAELSSAPFGWTRGEGLIGQDPHSNVYAHEKNVTGDITLTSPFTFYVATEAGPTATEGQYAGTLIVELWTP